MMHLETAFWASLSLGVGPFLFHRGFRVLRTRRLIANTPTAHMRSLAMGLVEINGTVETRSRLTAPFSGHDCAYWEVDIANRGRSGWITFHRNQSGQPFFLQDGTGAVLVYPRGSECKIAFSSEETYQGLMLPDCYADYMRAHTSALGQMSRLGTLRFRERVLEGGERLFVLGTATPRAQEHMIGEGDLVQATGTDGGSVSRRQLLDHEVVAVVRRGENESTFIISQESEKTLMLDLGFRSLFYLVGGPLLTLFGLGYWLMAMSSGQTPWSR